MSEDFKGGLRFIVILVGIMTVVMGALLLVDAYGQSKIDRCIEQSEARYDLNWERECSRLERGEDCALPGDIADALKDERLAANNLCVLRNN